MELSAFRNLFGDLQEYVCSILNKDELLSAMGAEFYSENSLDIEYQVKTALAKTGLACLVLTPRATYQGHNGIQQTFTCDELTLQIVENPVVNRPRLKRDNLDHGTAMDIAKQASDRLAGPQGGYFGKFTTKRIQEAEQSGLLVVTATFGCTVYETLSAVVSGDISGHWVEVPFVRMSELSDWIDDYLSTHVPIPEVSGYLPLSGGMMTGAISAYSNATTIDWGYDGSLAAGTPGIEIRTAGEDGYYRLPAQDGSGGPSEYDVMRRKDLSGLSSNDGETYIYDIDDPTWNITIPAKTRIEAADVPDFSDHTVMVIIGDGVSAIGESAFANKHQIYQVYYPRSLKVIETSAFANSTNSLLFLPYQTLINHVANFQDTTLMDVKAYAFHNAALPRILKFPWGAALDPQMMGYVAGGWGGLGNYNAGIYLDSPYPNITDDSIPAVYSELAANIGGHLYLWSPTTMSEVLEQMPVLKWTDKNWSIRVTPRPATATIYAYSHTYTTVSALANTSGNYKHRLYVGNGGSPSYSGAAAAYADELILDISVNTDFRKTVTWPTYVDRFINVDLSSDLNPFVHPGTRRVLHFYEYKPGRYAVEQIWPELPNKKNVPLSSSTPLTVTVPYDNGFQLQTPNGTPLIQTIDLNRTSINSLSTGNAEIGPAGSLVTYPGAGVDTTKLSSWQWVKTGETGIGSVISSEHNAILGEVAEDYVSFNWLIQQGYVTSADISSLTGDFLPLSGGQMSGSIGWDYGGQGGPQIYGPYNPQQLLFQTTYAPDAQKMVFLDFGRIDEEQGQRTIAFTEDIDAVLGDISALIHAS